MLLCVSTATPTSGLVVLANSDPQTPAALRYLGGRVPVTPRRCLSVIYPALRQCQRNNRSESHVNGALESHRQNSFSAWTTSMLNPSCDHTGRARRQVCPHACVTGEGRICCRCHLRIHNLPFVGSGWVGVEEKETPFENGFTECARTTVVACASLSEH